MKNIFHKISTTILTCYCLFVMGCSPLYIQGRVSTDTYTNLPQKSTFTLFTESRPTLSEQKIQEYIADKFSSLGYKRIDDAKQADYLVAYSYNLGSGELHVTSQPDYAYAGHETSPYTEYPRYFQISIVDVKASQKSDKIIFAFQGEVHSSGTYSDTSYLAQYFIDEIFINFGDSVENVKFYFFP